MSTRRPPLFAWFPTLLINNCHGIARISFLKGRDFPGTVCMSSSNLASSKPGIETHGTVKPRHSDPGAEVVLQVEGSYLGAEIYWMFPQLLSQDYVAVSPDENSYDASTRQRTNPLGYIVPTSFPPSDTSDKVMHANLNSTRDNRFVKILEAPSVNLKVSAPYQNGSVVV